jgi:hypothetical protein
MNEQRQQAYLQLIERLLSCPNGEENQILSANQKLLDTEFVQVVTEIAQRYEQEGKNNIAGWLRNLAAYLTPENEPTTDADLQTYLQFLQEVLRTTLPLVGTKVVSVSSCIAIAYQLIPKKCFQSQSNKRSHSIHQHL